MTTTPALHAVSSREELAALHRDILVPSFPADEQMPLEAFVASADDPDSQVLTLRDDHGVDVALTVGWFHRASGVLLLVYLAVRPGIRGGGYGGRLLTAALERWQADYSPTYIVGEVERPGDRLDADEAHGDAEARLRFYRRFGARRAAAPFFQPAPGPEGRRVPMHLMLVHASPDALPDGRAFTGDDPRLPVAAAPLSAFVAAYIEGSEGTVPADDEALALLAALAGERVDTTPL
ncbi:MAG: hypothetical protein QM713_16955 [Arachnia sp.]